MADMTPDPGAELVPDWEDIPEVEEISERESATPSLDPHEEEH
jgi:hypothetical protein